MTRRRKVGYFTKHARSSAFVVSLVLHGIIILVAISFVVVKALVREDVIFEAKRVKRPVMNLKKLTVPVNTKKKMQKPKLRKNIVVKKEVKSIEIKLPEMTGIKGGVGYLDGAGGGIGFGLDMDLFGSNKSFGCELIGTLYDLKLTSRRKPVKMTDKTYFAALSDFCKSWSTHRLDKYFQAPKKKYSTAYYIPTINADAAPKAFGVDDIVEPRYWVIHYKGKFSVPETGRYRFWGYGDDVLIVRVKKREVLQANWSDRKAVDWSSDDDEFNKKYKIFSRKEETLFVGDWISLEIGDQIPIEILVGECGGGLFAGALMIEQQGVAYDRGADGRPILPIFKTKAISAELAEIMNVRSDEATVDGPVYGITKELVSGIGY